MHPPPLITRAARDPAFRRSELENLRYYLSVGRGLAWFCGCSGVACWLFNGLPGHDWTSGAGFGFCAALALWTQRRVRQRIAGFEALERQDGALDAQR